MGPLRDKKDFVVSRKFLFAKRRASVEPFGYGASPFRDFTSKHADEITVQLDGIDHVKREDHHANRSQKNNYLIELKGEVAPGRGERWRKKPEDDVGK